MSLKIPAPAGFCSGASRRRISIPVSYTHLKFFLYSLKVSAAVLAALLFLAAVPAGSSGRLKSSGAAEASRLHPMSIYEQAQEYTRKLGDINLFDKEAFYYDQKEK